MTKFDVLELAEQVNTQSLTGAITEQLLSSGNDLYEATQIHGNIRCIRPSGEIFEGDFQSGVFVIKETLSL
jgi:hypothetical protein